jgi:hypothetical protein
VSENLRDPSMLNIIPYSDKSKACIVVTKLEEPYGHGTDSVVSIGCTLKGDVNNPTWRVHVPADLVSELIEVLREIEK